MTKEETKVCNSEELANSLTEVFLFCFCFVLPALRFLFFITDSSAVGIVWS